MSPKRKLRGKLKFFIYYIGTLVVSLLLLKLVVDEKFSSKREQQEREKTEQFQQMKQQIMQSDSTGTIKWNSNR